MEKLGNWCKIAKGWETVYFSRISVKLLFHCQVVWTGCFFSAATVVLGVNAGGRLVFALCKTPIATTSTSKTNKVNLSLFIVKLDLGIKVILKRRKAIFISYASLEAGFIDIFV